jgi:signal transduction histidine kinase/integral membrane sensor domain MASE1
MPAISRQYLVKVAIVAIAYFSSAWLTISLLGLGIDASAVWPSAGIALAALLVWGESVWPGIFLGDFLLMPIVGATWGLAFSSALGSTLSAMVGVKLLHRFKFSPSLSRLRDVLALVILAAMVAPLMNATLDMVTHSLAGKIAWSHFWQSWWILWLGDSTGVLIVTPLLLRIGLFSRRPWRKLTHQQIIEASICFSLLGGVSWVVFASKSTSIVAQYPLEYLPFPFLIWAALRFQAWGAICASFLVSTVAIAGALQGVGPFILQTANLHQAILLLQTFMGVVAITVLVLSAVMSERQRAERQLRETLERDRLLAEIALRIRQSLDIEQIFNTTVAEIRDLLKVDRVYIGYLKNDGQAQVVAESVASGYPSLLAWQPNQLLLNEVRTSISETGILIGDNVAQLSSYGAMREYYQRYEVKAALGVPLMVKNQQLGILVAHQCSSLRHWQKSEIHLLEQLATQVAIAIQQAQLYQQVQTLNNSLERQVKERTSQLQEKIQEVQQLYEMKNIFLQAVSHDLRTSIMGLLMILRNLHHRSGDNIYLSRSTLERIIQSSDRQLTLIDALSEDHFSEQHPLVLHRQRLSLKDLVEDVIVDWQPLFHQNKATLNSFVSDTLPLTYADISQLRCVFDNLLTNALRHNPPEINLTIEASCDRDMLRCTLTDNGVGMDKQQCEQIFKLYVRSLSNQRLTGIGLGSYQCRQIIEAHGGKIGVRSNPGMGSQFWFTLPFADSPAQLNSCEG